MRKSIAFLLLIAPFVVVAQKRDKSAEKFAATITEAGLKKHLYIIASAEMQGRGTPSAGLEKAADYIEAQFRETGLQPGNNGSYRQKFPVYNDLEEGSSYSLSINGKELKPNAEVFSITYDHTTTLRFSEFVFIGNELENIDLTGKLAVLIENTSPLNKRLNAVYSKGAAAVLVISKKDMRAMPVFGSSWTMQGYKPAQLPPAFGLSGDAARQLIGDAPQSGKAYKAEVILSTTRNTKIWNVSNVIGIVEGSDLKDEYVFITAHYDHLGFRDSLIYYGADDDGSGTTGVLKIAEAFAKAKEAGKGPRRTVVFMTVAGEEKGLWGSKYYSEHPVFPLEKTTVDLNIDMIGRIDNTRKKGDSTNYVYVVGDDKLSTDLKPISEGVNKLYTKMELDYKFNDPRDPNRIYYRSDHYNFASKGVPIIFYYDGMLNADYHKPTDTPDKINYTLMAKRAQLVFYTAWEMANRDTMLKRDLSLDPSFKR